MAIIVVKIIVIRIAVCAAMDTASVVPDPYILGAGINTVVRGAGMMQKNVKRTRSNKESLLERGA
ncbi:hypothetical protein [Cellvibrio fontiphilus]|uniref:Uncharacterized protein n=1 Tax=Cellvibrio fontiphilus TaxID=1815559 RepID=A0ABV7FD95_9GAMM